VTALAERAVPEAAMPTATWRDWSCQVRLVVSDPAALAGAVTDLEALMNRVELAASRFRSDSELCRANASSGRPTAVSRTLVNLVASALAEARRCDGAVDPTLGRDLERIGYDRDIDDIIDTSEPVACPPAGRPSWRDVRLDAAMGLLTVPRGAALDLGASAKAQTADWAAAQLAARFGCSVLVELGGDLAVAGGKHDWQILIAERAGSPGQQVTFSAGGLATSTTTVRRWHRGGETVSHIIDPATGMPARGPWRTVSVAAASATLANTCSTAGIVLGDRATAWLAEQGVAARLIDQDGRVTTLGGWPSDDETAGTR
jgi:thiamine biosynthesis lipoprotein